MFLPPFHLFLGTDYTDFRVIRALSLLRNLNSGTTIV